MSLRFPYRAERTSQPILTLGGRWVRPRPIVPITLVGPTGSWDTRGCLDTAADDTVFPEIFAAHIGLDLTGAPTRTLSGVGHAAALLRYAQIALRLTDGREQREWTAWVGFTAGKLKLPLLGFAGCLQFFVASFHGDREQVELTVNSLYPGT
jgi:hypothetical protein